MAKVTFNGPVAAFSGTISDLVYALQPDGSVNVRGLPEKKTKRSRKQLNQQDRMKHANAYWRSVKADPVKLDFYRSLPRLPGLGPRHFAVRDWFSSPVITDIDVTGYAGEIGQPIRITASDDSGVAEVGVQILDLANAVLEQGAAERESATDAWVYRGSKSLSSGQTVSIRVTAKDHPGNRALKECFAYAR